MSENQTVGGKRAALAAYCAVSAAIQFEWLRFAPIADAAATQYGTSVARIGLLSMLFPLMFVLLSLPAARLIDRMSVRASLRLIAALLSAGAVMRIAVSGFAGLVLAQLLFSLAQPIAVQLIARLVTVWFTESEGLMATSLGTLSLFCGIGLAFVLTPMTAPAIAPSLRLDAIALAALAMLIAVLVPADPQAPELRPAQPAWPTIRNLLRSPTLVGLLLLMLMGNGFFNAVFTWLEPLLVRRGLLAHEAGAIGLALLAGGVTGMALIGRFGAPRAGIAIFIVLSAISALVPAWVLLYSRSSGHILLAAPLIGALILAPLPLLIEAVTRHAGPQQASAALGLFWLAGNTGSALLIALLSFLDAHQLGGMIGGALLALLPLEAAVARWMPIAGPRALPHSSTPDPGRP